MKGFHFQIIAIIMITLCVLELGTGNIAKPKGKQLSRGVKRGKRANPKPLSSHVLDISTGRPAQGVKISLSKLDEAGQWQHISEQITSADGRVGKDVQLISGEQFTASAYKLNFDVGPYYQALGQKTFYPYIDVVFVIENTEEHYHVPIVLSPYGFSTYRGS